MTVEEKKERNRKYGAICARAKAKETAGRR